MQTRIVFMSLGIGLLAVTMTACSSGAKTTSEQTTSAATTTSAAASAATTTPATTTTPAATTTPAVATTSAVATTAPSGASGTTVSGSAGASAAGEIDACSLLPVAKASALVGAHLTSAKPSTIAPGQDQCAYHGSPVLGVTVIVYQPSSGVSWTIMNSVLAGVGKTKSLGGVGDRATVGAIELDVQAGSHLVAVQGAGGLLTGDYSHAVAVAKAVVAGLH